MTRPKRVLSMRTNGASPVFLASIKRETDSYENFELLTAIFKYLDLTGTFIRINGHRFWLEKRSLSEGFPVLVPCDTASDLECFRDYIRVSREVPEEVTGAFLYALRNIGAVLDTLYAGHGWTPVQAVSWDGFTEAYLERAPVIQDNRGRLLEPWWV
ncbi:hypothetical protein QFZ22_003768 [Streptomyces canus]|uniref:Uncharacterized protein n=1 Tax=Streptomyces canus TaxID=58343 RepID=A0AAW8FD84_9ACTN|nr:hypothetical protein [Streptomyces canus]MDQ0907783.1 hypothetical protein [Streptomyces canus]